GYGVGGAAVAEALWRAGCRDFFVATAEEGVALRGTLADARIYVFEGAFDDTAAELAAHRLVPVLNHRGQLHSWRRAAPDMAAAVHVDTGMHRLGFDCDLAPGDLGDVPVALLLTHLACADEPEHPMTRLQLERLGAVRALLPGVPTSIGNSAGILQGAALCGDLGRPGIGLYGGNPFVAGPSPVQPVVTLEGRIVQLRWVAAGEAVGYGATFTADAPMEVAVVGAGYGDGLPRLLSNRGAVALGGVRCPIVGRVSMDLTTVDVTGLGARVGDWVELFGASVSVDEVAGWAETIPYEVLSALGRRPVREFRRP
ncbi:MAG: alanine racemase, partial [Pseudomonadota bacterium]